MSLPVFKDFNKSVTDALKDDFDVGYSLKIKTPAPYGVNLTTTTAYAAPKEGSTYLEGKVSAKWAHSSGFTVDKAEMKSDGSTVTESSLTGLYPGLKLEFKGDSKKKGDLSAVYKCAHLTAFTELDLVGFSALRTSLWTNAGPAQAGVSAELNLGDKSLSVLDVAASYSTPKVFAGVQSTEKFSHFLTSASFTPNKTSSFFGTLSFTPEKSALKLNAGVSYVCGPTLTCKVKANCSGIVGVSAKQKLGDNCSVVGATEFAIRDPTNFKVGLTTTLG